jgi:prepilin-type processing-associated H-X9-DG protein
LYLLPYLDQSPIYSRIDLQVTADRYVVFPPGVDDVNGLLKRIALPVFLCPSDAGAFPDRRNNYRASVGVTAFPRFANVIAVPPLPGNGAFFPVNKPVRAQNFVDGLSETAGFSEKLGGSGDAKRFDARRDFFELSAVVDPSLIWNSPNYNALHVKACASLTDPNPPHEATAGEYWFYAGLADTWYNHLLTPNHAIPDCGAVFGLDGCGVMTARSFHPGGVNCMMMDGAVRFLANGVSLRVWEAIGTRDGHDPVSLD